MNIPKSWRRGAVLLQTLVIAILLSYISVMIMKWILQRYSLATRVYRSNISRAHTNGYAMQAISGWGFGNPGGSNAAMPDDNKNVNLTVGNLSGGMQQVTVTTEEDW